MPNARPLALVTGASRGIGFELAKLFADDGYDLVVAADDLRKPEDVELPLRGMAARPTRSRR